jgi:hypothetical protein
MMDAKRSVKRTRTGSLDANDRESSDIKRQRDLDSCVGSFPICCTGTMMKGSIDRDRLLRSLSTRIQGGIDLHTMEKIVDCYIMGYR